MSPLVSGISEEKVCAFWILDVYFFIFCLFLELSSSLLEYSSGSLDLVLKKKTSPLPRSCHNYIVGKACHDPSAAQRNSASPRPEGTSRSLHIYPGMWQGLCFVVRAKYTSTTSCEDSSFLAKSYEHNVAQ